MELRHLRYFVAVARGQNVTRAAAELRVAQPALSRQIRDLEEELGFALFVRSARSLVLTPAGTEFLKQAGEILAQVKEGVAAARVVAEGDEGSLTIGYAPTLTVTLLPDALRAFETAVPKARVHLRDLSTREMLAGLCERKLDLALMIEPSKKALQEVEFLPLRALNAHVAVAKQHLFSRRRSVSLDRVSDERILAYASEEYPEYHEWITRVFASAARMPKIAEEHDSVTSLIAAVEAGRGVAMVLDGFKALAGSRLKLCRVSPAPTPHFVGIAFLKGRQSPTAAQFLEIVRRTAEAG
jgi:LysR family transcriptional regulator, benzoate and cis,cis-muconate-responsive activator of ben and cat genes